MNTTELKCIIVDDEHPARMILGEYVRKTPGLEAAASCENAMQALQALQKHSIDLMFLDIQMPDLTGLELLRNLRTKPLVILTTAYSEFALEGYELEVTDYLLKPIPFERFLTAVEKAREQARLRKKADSSPDSVSPTEPPERRYLFVSTGHKLERVNFEDILYVEGMREYVRIVTPEKRLVTLAALKDLEQTFPSGNFMRVHKSWIAALDKVEAVMGNSLEIGGKLIPISKARKEEVLARLQG